jgi:hypothetical protein
MVSSSVMGDAIRQAPASRSLIAELVGSSTVIERKVVMPPVGVELSPPYTDNPFHRVLQEIRYQTAARGRGDADARRRWALPRPTDDPCEETAVQRPIAGPQRSDVRHCVGRVVLDAARFAGAALPRRSLRSTRNNLECSHLGGDRFAVTMLVLPEGLCYGEWTRPSRRISSVCISTIGSITGFSADAPRYRMPCKPHVFRA